MAQLIESGQVKKAGAARSQRYVLPRTVPGMVSNSAKSSQHTLPVMLVNAAGQAALFAHVTPLDGGAFWVDDVAGASVRHAGLPWLLDDTRPQGFIGRSFARAHPDLQLASDPRQWSNDDVLRVLCPFGENLPGNLIVGDASSLRFYARMQQNKFHSTADYPQLAQQAMQNMQGGSSVGARSPSFAPPLLGAPCCLSFRPLAIRLPSSARAGIEQFYNYCSAKCRSDNQYSPLIFTLLNSYLWFQCNKIYYYSNSAKLTSSMLAQHVHAAAGLAGC